MGGVGEREREMRRMRMPCTVSGDDIGALNQLLFSTDLKAWLFEILLLLLLHLLLSQFRGCYWTHIDGNRGRQWSKVMPWWLSRGRVGECSSLFTCDNGRQRCTFNEIHSLVFIVPYLEGGVVGVVLEGGRRDKPYNPRVRFGWGWLFFFPMWYRETHQWLKINWSHEPQVPGGTRNCERKKLRSEKRSPIRWFQ